MRRICVVDTDWLLAYLAVPGFERAGPDRDPVTSAVAQAQWTEELAAGSQFILAYAVIIEAGNHVAHARHSRREYAMEFARIIRDTLDENAPWAPFDETPDAQRLRALLEDISAEWPRQVEAGVSIGDYALRHVVDFYQRVPAAVRILSGDAMLQAYQSVPPDTTGRSLPAPRRRS